MELGNDNKVFINDAHLSPVDTPQISLNKDSSPNDHICHI